MLDAGRLPVLQVTMCEACMHVALHVVGDAAMLHAQRVGRVQTFNALFARCFACFVLFACAVNDTLQKNSSPCANWAGMRELACLHHQSMVFHTYCVMLVHAIV